MIETRHGKKDAASASLSRMIDSVKIGWMYTSESELSDREVIKVKDFDHY